jgi:hypothetical protein
MYLHMGYSFVGRRIFLRVTSILSGLILPCTGVKATSPVQWRIKQLRSADRVQRSVFALSVYISAVHTAMDWTTAFSGYTPNS